MYLSVVEEKNIDENEKYFAGDYGSVHDGVEIMAGYTSDEGLITLGSTDIVKMKLEMARNYLELFSPQLLSFNLTPNQKLDFGRKIRKYYFKDSSNISDGWEQLSNFYSIDMFVHGVVNFAKLCAKKEKVYLYKFSCKSERNMFAHLLNLTDIIKDKPVTCHADDIFYLFNANLLPNKVDKKSDTFQLMERVIKLWTNFAKYGNPTPDESLGVKWANYTVEKQDYLDIGNKFVPGTAPNADEVKLWDTIFEESGYKLY
ncbi:unnamed protein product [Arctia plantaginis]|uniref:Carboxylesterase type B domain-containing protein n=1 Tax=Arctia plantaginis TaxID=874455 RepID=A0A8S1APZ8_ARCPL|nr:unnamed protein product [Arctia plantaginis]